MIYEIPINIIDGNHSFEITLDGVVYVLRYSYNSRLDRWVLDILDADGNEILCGSSLVLGVDFLARYAFKTLPQGKLFLLNIKEPTVEATEQTLGKEVKLYYETV